MCKLINKKNCLLIKLIGPPYQGQPPYNQYGGPEQYGPPGGPPGQYPPNQAPFPPPNRNMYPPYGPEGDG